MSTHNRSLGIWGEDTALQHLQTLGHTLLARNYRCPYGEIDLITRQGDDIVFVEVKTRLTRQYGPPELAVTPAKQQHLLNTAQHYLLANELDDQPWRIDVVAVQRHPDGFQIEVFEHAVTAGP